MNIEDKPFDPVYAAVKDIEYVQSLEFPVIEQEKAAPMLAAIRDAKNSGDSVGGTVECCILGLPAGLGEPIFDGIENKISCVVFGIPAVKGIEFGAGFDSQLMLGSENNDEYHIENGKVRTKTNNAGGILGGLSTGMPLIFKAAFKPTPSIAKQQASVNLIEQTNTDLIINGRHDPCIVPRAVPCVEAAAAIAVLDLLYLGGF
jgi:chorismate synthase